MNTTPLADDLWQGIGGHFDSISQVICEFIDNAISNFENSSTARRNINIILNEVDGNNVCIKIEDTGTGISDFESVLRLGDKSIRETPLNEHGFGIKHALACANPANNNWKIYSRTQQNFDDDIFYEVSAPYSFNLEKSSHPKNDWEGIFNGSGTMIIFTCSRSLFNTIQRGIPGIARFNRCLDYLKEELGYTYSGVIKNGKVTITINSDSYNESTPSVEPDWQGFYKPAKGNKNVDLGGGKLKIEYAFGEMGRGTYLKHYKRNMSTSGVEIRVNGRLLMSNIFKDIWEIENHPSYNHFLVIINLVSNNRNTLPKTRTSKNGIRSGDKKLENLFEWIKKTHPTPHKETSGAVSEKELVEELANLKEKQTRDKIKHIEQEFKVFKNINSPVSVDLYFYDGKYVILYEAKKDTADVQNLYQLLILMYWDGAVADTLTPTEGILLASSFSPGVSIVLSLLNTMKDQNGNNYNFSTKTWNEENINYPGS